MNSDWSNNILKLMCIKELFYQSDENYRKDQALVCVHMVIPRLSGTSVVHHCVSPHVQHSSGAVVGVWHLQHDSPHHWDIDSELPNAYRPSLARRWLSRGIKFPRMCINSRLVVWKICSGPEFISRSTFMYSVFTCQCLHRLMSHKVS